ncbi:MAG: serine/threonine protein kinase, partial [Acidimicrobiales bacterium]|nr:serine/threonine protein kinase [Acidimicrobiales bacterium]
MLLSQMTDQIGRVLGSRYRLVAPLGSGSSAQVFLADDVRLQRKVAVKVLHPALADDQTFLRRFRAEAQASAKLNHSNIVKLLDSGSDDGPYLVTEFVDGGSLRALLDLGRRLTVAQAADVGLGAARGLDFAHRQGFVHRDIKPANLLFGQDGRLRIADFGVARALAEAAWTEPTGAVLGTARYASPEQANGQAATGRSDVYSLALVLVEAVTGHVPFATDTTLSTLRARVDTDLTVGAELGPLAEVLEWAGRADPDRRPDAAQLRDALADVANGLEPAAPLPLAGAFPADELAPFVDPDPTHLPTAADPGDGDSDGDG